jgi:hypothetical protein
VLNPAGIAWSDSTPGFPTQENMSFCATPAAIIWS